MKAKLKTFAHVFIKSISEPAYYKDVLKANFAFTLKYYLLFFFFLTLANTIVFQFRVVPQIVTLTTDIVHNLTTNYPEDLVISLQSDQLTITGATQPLYVPFPESLSDIKSQTEYDNLFVFNTTEATTSGRAILTFTQQNMIVRELDGSKQTIPLSEIGENLTIDKNSVQLTTSALQGRFDQIRPYIWLGFFAIMLVFAPLSSFIIVAVYSLVTMLAANLMQNRIGYKKSLQIGLHTVTFAETANFLQKLLYPGLDLPSIFAYAFFGATALAIYSIRTKRG